mgnify:CR=1 FL=1
MPGDLHNAELDAINKAKENRYHPDRMLQFFSYEHLPAELQKVSKPFHALACSIVEQLPMNPERTVALRKLLEAKDCAVRALIYKESNN